MQNPEAGTEFSTTSLYRSQVSEMTKGLNKQVHAFHRRPLDDTVYPALWGVLYEKFVQMEGSSIWPFL